MFYTSWFNLWAKHQVNTQAPTSTTKCMYAVVLDIAETQSIFLVLRVFL